ncbi:MAG: HypC/HybG/HupF family hydrogenase formation chaperone [Candidatus Limnocylindria bacterium]
MCLTAPARVLAVSGGDATVLIGGRERRASTLVVPEVEAGDWVIVAAGTIVQRLDVDEARQLAVAVGEAYGKER